MTGGTASPHPGSGSRVRVALVDDSRLVRAAVRRVLEAEADMEVVWEAADGREAVERATTADRARSADVILLDVQMPGLDGLATLDELRRVRCPARVLMLSSLTRRGARETLEALGRGAADYICKPAAADRGTSNAFETELLTKIRAWARFAGRSRAARPAFEQRALRECRPVGDARNGGMSAAARPGSPVSGPVRRKGPDVAVVGIAASTGGPQALATLFGGLPPPLPVPVLVTQHMPEGFTAALAEQLSRTTGHRCEEARSGVVPEAGHVYIAPGGRHLLVEPGSPPRLRLADSPPVHFCRPAADPMFSSMAESYGARAMAVVLTGMGRDGAEGAARIAARGGIALAQDEDSSVVWGMPGALVRTGAASAVLPLGRIPEAIVDVLGGVKR